MEIFSYVIPRDFGFAPNPFHGMCTLATCKPQIRKSASVGDWVIGTGTKVCGIEGMLVFAMEISQKITFNEYWSDPAFQCKKPNINGSLKQTYGDNIYHLDEVSGMWIQADSHHSYADGTTNYHNLNRDTSKDSVLISKHFFYFGNSAQEIPDDLLCKVVKKGPGHKRIRRGEDVTLFIEWMNNSFEPGYYDKPRQFDSFKRYNGI
jgi:hypothetical protein